MTQSHISIDDLYSIVSLSDPRFSPDGQWLAYVRTEMDRGTNGYKSAIWIQHIRGESGWRRPFTSGAKHDSAPRWSPDGRWLAFVSDRGDDRAKPQLYLMPTDGGEARRLTEMENGAGEPQWSPDGKYLAFTSRLNAGEMEQELAAGAKDEPESPLDPDEIKRRAEEKEKAEAKKADPRVIDRFVYRAGTSYYDDRTAHLYILELSTEMGEVLVGQPRRMTDDARNYADPQWLPDGSALLATIDRRPGEDDFFSYPNIVRVPLDGGEPQILTGADTADHNPRPSPDGKWIAYNSLPGDVWSIANAEIKLIPASGGESRVLTSELDAHAQELCWGPDGASIYFMVGDKGLVDLRRLSLDSGAIETVASGDYEMAGYALSPDGSQVGFVASTDRAPYDLYLADLGGTQRSLTQDNGGWLAGRTLGDVEELWFDSPDGTPIHGWIVKPPDFDPEQKYPLALSIHGGPHAMWSRHGASIWHEWQVLAAAGYVVFASNPRGSDGYGQDFRAAALNRWGEADLPDLLAGLEQVLAKGYVDAERLVVTGGSYGGFMTAWIVGHEDRFKAAVAQRGVYDLIGFYGTTDIPRFAEREFGCPPWEDPELMWKYSPLAYVENVHTPLLILHSENDYRAPIPAAEGLFVALRRLGREVEFVRYPRDGHELSRSGEPKHRVDRLERMVAWFDKYVK